jgi:hypothetical protein
MAGPWGVLPVFPAATFTEVEEDVMSMAAPLGVLAEVWQQPPPKLKKMLMTGPLGMLSISLAAATTEVEEDVDGGPLGGAGRSPAASTTEVEEDVDGGPSRR